MFDSGDWQADHFVISVDQLQRKKIPESHYGFLLKVRQFVFNHITLISKINHVLLETQLLFF